MNIEIELQTKLGDPGFWILRHTGALILLTESLINNLVMLGLHLYYMNHPHIHWKFLICHSLYLEMCKKKSIVTISHKPHFCNSSHMVFSLKFWIKMTSKLKFSTN